MINAIIKVKGGAPFATFVDEVNERIESFSNNISKRAGKSDEVEEIEDQETAEETETVEQSQEMSSVIYNVSFFSRHF